MDFFSVCIKNAFSEKTVMDTSDCLILLLFTTIFNSLMHSYSKKTTRGRSCNDNSSIIRRVLDKRIEYNLDTHIIFVKDSIK